MDYAQSLEIKGLSLIRDLREAEENGQSEIKALYRDAVVFITGGTGFLGKQLLEKLFRACRDIKTVYLLTRGKKGKTMHERLEEQLKDPVYDELRKVYPDFAKRIVPVEGNVAKLRLGLKDEDWQMLTKEVNFIYHSAATVRFDEPIKVAIISNVRGTREVVQLAKQCCNLRSMVHVSTGYAHCSFNTELKEEFYDSPMSPSAIIEMVETLDDQKLEAIEPILTEGWPNTYTYSKAIAEEVIRTMGYGLPVCVIRPCIVTAAYREPSPGWLDISNCYGPSGIIFGSGLGLIRTFLMKPDNKLDLVPVDYVNNLTIAASWETVKKYETGEKDIKIYILARRRNPIDWEKMQTWTENQGRNLVGPLAMWYCYGIGTTNRIMFWLLTLFLHRIPAFFADIILMVMGSELRLTKVYEKAYKINTLLSYFLFREWIQHDDNTLALSRKLSTTDREIFSFDMADVDFTLFMTHWCLGLRKYIGKDGLRGTEAAVKKQRWLKVANAIVIFILYPLLIWKVFSLSFWFLTLCLSFVF